MSRRNDYKEFLKSEFWKGLSKVARERDGKCLGCGSVKRLQAHHIRYPQDWFATKLEDLKTLCRECHRMEHGMANYTDIDEKADEIEKCLNYQQRPPVKLWREFKALVVTDNDIILFGEVMFKFVFHQVSCEREKWASDWWMDKTKNEKYWLLGRRVRNSIWNRVSP